MIFSMHSNILTVSIWNVITCNSREFFTFWANAFFCSVSFLNFHLFKYTFWAIFPDFFNLNIWYKLAAKKYLSVPLRWRTSHCINIDQTIRVYITFGDVLHYLLKFLLQAKVAKTFLHLCCKSSLQVSLLRWFCPYKVVVIWKLRKNPIKLHLLVLVLHFILVMLTSVSNWTFLIESCTKQHFNFFYI